MVLEQGDMRPMFPNQKTAETPIFFALAETLNEFIKST